MAINDKNRIYDGWTGLEAGVDAGRAANAIDINQCESAENITFRGGKPQPRPGWKKLAESFSNPDHSYYNTTVGGHISGEDAGDVVVTGQEASTIYKTGIMQSAIVYNPHGNGDCIMAMIGGRLFKIVPGISTAQVTEIAPITDIDGPVVNFPGPRFGTSFRNRNDQPIAYMSQADKWLIVQDGFSRAIIYDSTSARRAKLNVTFDKTEIPTGTITAYGMGRIVTIVNDRDVAFGDLLGSHPLSDPADSLILFTERNFLAEGFDASVPAQNGPATGISFFPQLDTSTGNGQMLVFSRKAASSFFLSLPRESWKTSQFQIFGLMSTGATGHRSTSIVNEDLWMRADDGERTFRQARSEQSGWAHIPLSTNVRQFIRNDAPWLLKYGSSMVFDNRIIMTCNPSWNHGRPSHSGLLVVDFDILSSFGEKYKPAWEGHWTMPAGIKIVQVFSGEFNKTTRAFAYGIDETGENQLYELSLSNTDDFDSQKIPWEFVSRSFDFQKVSQQSSPFSEVDLYDADMWVNEVAGDGNSIKSFYRPDGYPGWIPWANFPELSAIGVPGAINIGGVPTRRAGFDPRMSFGKPAFDTDPTTKRKLTRGFEFQVKISGVGHVRIDRFRLHAQKQIEKSTSKHE